jgi:hypothetical protein
MSQHDANLLAQHFPLGVGGAKGGRIPNIDRDLDRYKAEQARHERAQHRQAQQARREREAKLKALSGDGTPAWKLRLATVIKRADANTPEEVAQATEGHKQAIIAALSAAKFVPDAVMRDHVRRES